MTETNDTPAVTTTETATAQLEPGVPMAEVTGPSIDPAALAAAATAGEVRRATISGADLAPAPAPAPAARDPYPKDGGAVMRDPGGDELFVFAGTAHYDGKGTTRDGVDDKLAAGWTMVEDRRAK